jgi:hypothetical protein
MSTLNLILYFLIFFSLVGLGIIIYRKIPVLARLSEEEMTILDRKRGIIQKIREIDYKQHWLNFMIASEKFLRRIKIVFLKIENLLSKCINFLRNHSQIMTRKSKEWIRQREMKRRKIGKIGGDLLGETKDKISIKIDKKEEVVSEIRKEGIDGDDLPISELKKPIKEEQKWIDLIVEDPKNITAYKFLGLLYWRQHNYSDAKASLEMAVKLGSKDKKVKEVLKELKKMKIE